MDHSPSPFPDQPPELYDHPGYDGQDTTGMASAGDILPTEYAYDALHGSRDPDEQRGIDERRKHFYSLDKDTGGGNVTEEMPVRFATGYAVQPHLAHAAGVRTILLEQQLQPLLSGHELTVTMRENAIVWLEPGDEGALATDEISGCTVVAGLAHYADGWRSAYVSHHNPPDDDSCRRAAPVWGRALSAHGMRQFAANVSDREGLERIAFAVVHFSGLPQLPINGYDWPRDGQRITDDLADIAAEMKETHNATVVFEPYKLAVLGDHTVTAHMAGNHSAIYFNDKQIMELGL